MKNIAWWHTILFLLHTGNTRPHNMSITCRTSCLIFLPRLFGIFTFNVVHHLPFPKHSNPSVSLVFSTTQIPKWAVGVMCGYTLYMKVFKPPTCSFLCSLLLVYEWCGLWSPLYCYEWEISDIYRTFSDTKLSCFIQLHLGHMFSFPFVIILEPNTQW